MQAGPGIDVPWGSVIGDAVVVALGVRAVSGAEVAACSLAVDNIVDDDYSEDEDAPVVVDDEGAGVPCGSALVVAAGRHESFVALGLIAIVRHRCTKVARSHMGLAWHKVNGWIDNSHCSNCAVADCCDDSVLGDDEIALLSSKSRIHHTFEHHGLGQAVPAVPEGCNSL